MDTPEQVDTPNPVEIDNIDHSIDPTATSEANDAEPKKPKKEVEKEVKTARSAVEAAVLKVESKDKEEKEEKEEKETLKVKSEGGTKEAKAKPDTKATEEKPAENPAAKANDKPEVKADEVASKRVNAAPKRFSEQARAEWEKTPDTVKHEVNRVHSELKSGLEGYQKKFEPLKPYEQMAKEQGTTIDRALQNYTQIDGLLETDIVAGLDQIATQKGYTLREIAAHVLGQPLDEVQTQQDSIVLGLQHEIATLRNEMGKVTNNLQSSQESAIQNQVNEFKANHPRFDELEPDMAFLISSGRTLDLSEAYRQAELLNPAANASQAVQTAQVVQPTPSQEAQTLKGQKSIIGSPNAGSEISRKRTSSSIKDSIKHALSVVN